MNDNDKNPKIDDNITDAQQSDKSYQVSARKAGEYNRADSQLIE